MKRRNEGPEYEGRGDLPGAAMCLLLLTGILGCLSFFAILVFWPW